MGALLSGPRRRIGERAQPAGLFRLAALILAAGSLAGRAAALDPSRSPADYIRTSWRNELPSLNVLAIAQTRDGYLWLATYDGLVRFDGVAFELFDRSNVPEMGSSAVLTLAADGSGALWALTGDGRLLRFSDGKVSSWGKGEGLTAKNAERLFVDRDGDLWIGGRTVSRLRKGARTIETVALETWSEGAPRPDATIVRAFAQTPDGTIWAGTYGGGLRAFRGGAWEILSPTDGLAELAILSLLADPNGSLWIGTHSAGLQRLSAGRFETWRARDAAPGRPILVLGRDPDGNLWVGTDGDGLLRFRDGRFESLGPSDAGGDAAVRSLLASDSDGSLWVGSHGGLTRLRNGLFSALRVRDGLTVEVVRSLFEDSRGRVWIGTDGGGLHLLEGGRIVPAPGAEPLATAKIRSIGEDLDGGIWVGTQYSGVFLLAGGRLRTLPAWAPPQSQQILSIRAARNGDVWVGSAAGLSRHRRREWSAAEPLLTGEGVYSILETRDGTLLAGTYQSGVFRLKEGRESWLTDKDGLASNKAFALFEDAAGAVWIGTSQGLSRWNPGDGMVTTWAGPEALGGQQVFSILEDDAGFLWVSNNRGVHRLSKSGLEAAARGAGGEVRLVSFGNSDGMPSRQCSGANQPTAVRTRGGQLLFPTSAGLALVDPNHVIAGPRPPAMVLRTLLVDGAEVPPADELSLGADVRRLQVHFAPFSLLAPERLTFRYRLDGLDLGWHETRLRQVDFTTLPPGSYRLHVQATYDKETWGEQELRVGLHVAAPLLRNPAFWAAFSVLLLFSAFASFGAYTARRDALERKLHDLVEQKTAALAEANRLLEDLALADPLTGIPNRRQLDAARRVEWSRCRRLGLPLAEIVFDVDNFKAYNDAFGHPAGDECLKAVSRALSERVGRRAGDLLARAGGEEFVALLPAAGPDEALKAAEEACRGVAALAIPHAVPLHGSIVTVSAGVAATVPGKGEPEALIAAADAALYAAKKLGRNRAVKADSVPSPGAPGPGSIEAG